jgi:hypothetical protein
MADAVAVTFSATTMEGELAQDPALQMVFREAFGDRTPLISMDVHPFVGSATVSLDRENTPATLLIEPSLSRFDVIEGAPFQPYRSPRFAFKKSVVRLPSAWTFSFSKLADLPTPRFERLRKILDAGGDVDVLGGEHIGDLRPNYDSLAPMDYLAKGTLLNLYSVLCDEVDPVSGKQWIEFVNKIVRIGRERFVAEVDVSLYESLSTILKSLDTTYKSQGFLREPDPVAAGHPKNIPGRYGPFDSMLSVKRWYRQGNVQWTVSRIPRPGDNPIFLLDCDMDEHANLAFHTIDMAAHIFNGGTHLIAMHEYIVATSAADNPNGISTVQLGYTLV